MANSIIDCQVAGEYVPSAKGSEAILMKIHADVGYGMQRHVETISIYVDVIDMDVTLTTSESSNPAIVPLPR